MSSDVWWDGSCSVTSATLWSSYSPKHGRKLEILQMRKRSISFLTDTVKEVWRHNQDMGEVIVKQEKTFRETWPYQTIGLLSLSVWILSDLWHIKLTTLLNTQLYNWEEVILYNFYQLRNRSHMPDINR